MRQPQSSLSARFPHPLLLHTGGFRRGRDPGNRDLASSATLPFIFTSHLGLRIRTQTQRRTQQPAQRTTLQAGTWIRAYEGSRELYPAVGPGQAARPAPGEVDDLEMRQVPLNHHTRHLSKSSAPDRTRQPTQQHVNCLTCARPPRSTRFHTCAHRVPSPGHISAPPLALPSRASPSSHSPVLDLTRAHSRVFTRTR